MTSHGEILFDSQRFAILDYQARERLAILRLVKKSFCYSASVRLFRHIIAKPDVIDRRLPPLVRLWEISNSPNATYVRQIDLGCSERGKSTEELKMYVEDLAGILLPCLHRFPNLRAIAFDDPSPSPPQEYRQVYINTATTALLYVPLPNLVELELYFPITNSFRHFFPTEASPLRTPIQGILGRPRSLRLFVRESTGTQDQRYFWQQVLPEYAALPNNAHSSHLFKMVELATNLEFLTIGSTDYLRFDPEPLSQNRPRYLYLNSVSVSSDGLMLLLISPRSQLGISSSDTLNWTLGRGNMYYWNYAVYRISSILPSSPVAILPQGQALIQLPGSFLRYITLKTLRPTMTSTFTHSETCSAKSIRTGVLQGLSRSPMIVTLTLTDRR
jgi:hypothetical protein